MPAATLVRIIWATISEALARERIVARGDARDQYKLQHWEQYRTRRFDPDPVLYPELVRYDNTHHDPTRFEALLRKLA